VTTLEGILAAVVALQGFTSIRFELLGRQVKKSLMPPPLLRRKRARSSDDDETTQS
jgi:hypothetical protein